MMDQRQVLEVLVVGQAVVNTVLAAAAIQAVRISWTDPLTGLPNRRRFDADLRWQWMIAGIRGMTFSICALDMNGFKLVNDRCGHPEGDAVLKVTAHLLKKAFRKVDTVYRCGGDEFVVVLPGAVPGDVEVVVDRAVEQVNVELAEYAARRRLTLPGFPPVSIMAGSGHHAQDNAATIADARLMARKTQQRKDRRRR